MNFVYLALYVIITGVHLYGTLRNNRYLRGCTKGLMLLLLLGFYLESASPRMWTMAAALLFSWAGDLLLAGKGNAWFAAGGIAFMASHAFFACSYLSGISLSVLPLPLMIAIGLVFAAAVTFIFIRLKPHLPKALFWPMALYLLVNGAMNCVAIYRHLCLGTWGSVVLMLGALLFFVSDSVLFFTRFKKDTIFKSHFAVMLTYCAGELLIVLGMIFTA